MKDLPISVTVIQNTSNSNNPLANINNNVNSLSNMVMPVSPSDGWGIYGNQNNWADLHLR